MVGKLCGFTAQLEDIAPKSTSSHCVTLCNALAVRKIPNTKNGVRLGCEFDKIKEYCHWLSSRNKSVLQDIAFNYMSRYFYFNVVFQTHGPSSSNCLHKYVML